MNRCGKCGRTNKPTGIFCLECGTLLRSGSLLGKSFRLKQRLETGLPGWTRYLGFDTNAQRDICLNLVTIDNQEMHRMLEDWVTQIKGLEHKNIVPTLKYYNDDQLGIPFVITVDGCDRRTFREILEEVGNFTLGQAREYILPICDALAYAHGMGVCHGDIRPENLILTQRGEIRLMNFSLAQCLQTANIPVSDFIPGKLYETPEDIKEEIDDLYRLGILLSEMLGGSLSRLNYEKFVISFAVEDVDYDFRFSWENEAERQKSPLELFKEAVEKIDEKKTRSGAEPQEEEIIELRPSVRIADESGPSEKSMPG